MTKLPVSSSLIASQGKILTLRNPLNAGRKKSLRRTARSVFTGPTIRAILLCIVIYAILAFISFVMGCKIFLKKRSTIARCATNFG